MEFPSNRIPVECNCTQCIYNNNRTCNFQGRLQINADGECQSMEKRGRSGPGPF